MGEETEKNPDQAKKLGPEEKYPTNDRSVTDIVFLIIFYILIIAFIAAGVVGFIMGSPKRIMTPYDESGHKCGESGTPVEGYPYLYFRNMTKKEWTKNNACVKECPGSKKDTIDCYPHGEIVNCTENLVAKESVLFANRFCYPVELIEKKKNQTKETIGFSNKLVDQTNQQAYYDITHSWRVLLVAVVLTVGLCILLLFLLKMCPKLIITICLIGVIVVMGLLGYFFYRSWREFANGQMVNTDKGKFYLIAAIVIWSIGALLICAVICFWTNIESSAKVIKISADYLSSNTRVMIVPIIFSIFFILFMAYFVISGMYLFTVGFTKRQKKYPFGEISWLPYWE